MEPLFQTIVKEETVLSVAISRSATKQKGKTDIGPPDAVCSDSQCIGRVPSIIIETDSPLPGVFIGFSARVHLQVKGNAVRIWVLFEGLYYAVGITLIITDIIISKEQNIPLSS